MTESEAVLEFRTAAMAKGGLATSASADRTLHQRMKSAFYFLRSLGPSRSQAFRDLLRDESPWVRSWVAAQLISEGDPEGRRVIEVLAKEPGLVGFSNMTALREFDAGRLGSPFSENHNQAQVPSP